MVLFPVPHERLITQRFQQAVCVEPGAPSRSSILDVVQAVPGSAVPDDFRLEEPGDRFGQGVVVRVPAAADRRLDPGLGEPLGLPEQQVLDAAVAVMHHPCVGVPIMQRLLQRVEGESAGQRARGPPADDPPGEDIDHEGDVDEAALGRDRDQIRHLELIGP